jgi:hypothetical protein
MYDLRMRRGPEGRRLNVSPARKGWGVEGDDAERRRCGTVPRCHQPDFGIPSRRTTMSTESTNPLIWTALAGLGPHAQRSLFGRALPKEIHPRVHNLGSSTTQTSAGTITRPVQFDPPSCQCIDLDWVNRRKYAVSWQAVRCFVPGPYHVPERGPCRHLRPADPGRRAKCARSGLS